MTARRRTATTEPVPTVPPRLLVAPEAQNRLTASLTWTNDDGVIVESLVGKTPTAAWSSIAKAAALGIESMWMPGQAPGEMIAINPTEVISVR